jgi:ABC-type maltose transport system permease subunit
MSVNDFVISYEVHSLILCILVIPAMLFIQYKLFLVVRKSRKNKRISPDIKKNAFFEKYIELFAGSRLSSGDIHSMVRLHWINNKLARNKKYFE